MTITLVKLGGSIITDKAIQNALRRTVLQNLWQQVAEAQAVWQQSGAEQQLILSHGQGSFGHFPAKQYEITQGLHRADSVYGMAKVLEAVVELNHQVVQAGLAHQLPVVPWALAQALLTNQRQAEKIWLDVLLGYLQRKLIPVTCGDVVLDAQQGCAVWSGETILNYVAQQLQQQGHIITQVIQVGEVAGVLDAAGKVIPEITPQSWQQHQGQVTTKTRGVDVTGGMLKKVTESLALLEKTGIETWIIDGFAEKNLYQALTGKAWIGTKIAKAVY